MTSLILPQEPERLSKMLGSMLDSSRTARIPSAVEWYIAYHYLNGARVFDQVSYSSGEVLAFYEDLQGVLPFKFEDLLGKYQTEVGRLQRLDIAPSVKREGAGLESARRAAIAHVTLDTLMRSQPLDALKLELVELMCLYGTVGGTNWVVSEPGMVGSGPDPKQQMLTTSDVHVISVVPPWEILPLPPSPITSGQVAGICRERWVPLEWLKQRAALGSVDLKLGSGIQDPKLRVQEAPPLGLQPQGAPKQTAAPAPTPVRDIPSKEGRGSQSDKAGSITVPHVLLKEVWIYSASGRVQRYIIMVGDIVGFDRDWMVGEDGKPVKKTAREPLPVVPMGVARYIGGLGFFGRGFVGPKVSINAEIESMLLSLFRNIQDLDQFGFTFYPETWGIPRDYFQTAKPGRRFTSYSPDPVNPNIPPHTIAPVTTGQLPGQVATLGMELLDRQSQQPSDLLAGKSPGRQESARGLDILYQTSTVPLGGPAISIASLFSGIYSSILWHTSIRWKSLRVNLLSLLDDIVVGIRYNPTTGTLELDDNVLPDPSEVQLSIRSKEPVDLEQRKAELILMKDKEIISDMEFRITNRKESLGLPTGNEVEWQNYIRAVINNILWFGDGKTPGEAFVTNYDAPNIHEYVVLRRIASPEFALASKEVQAKFTKRLLDLRAARGDMPPGMPFMEDAADEAMRAAGEAQGGPGGPGGEMGMPLGMEGLAGGEMRGDIPEMPPEIGAEELGMAAGEEGLPEPAG